MFIKLEKDKINRWSRKKFGTFRYVSEDRFTVHVLLTEDGFEILTED